MQNISDINLGRRARRLRVDTLVRLRWLAVAGQSAAVLITHFGFEFPLPAALCFLVIAASAWLNIGLRLRFALNDRLDDKPASVLLACDILQLSGLLGLTGGLENPFALLFLAPVMISAVSLSMRLTFYLGILTIVAATVLMFVYLPLPWFAGSGLALPFLYRSGIWTAIVLGSAFIGIYASRVAEEARRLSDALAATELVLAREQHLTQLDGLAAAAAHELGTPLATITLVVRELAGLVPASGPIHDDIALLTQELARCRAILGKLASLGDDTGGVLEAMSISHLLEEVVTPHRDFGVKLEITLDGHGDAPICPRNSAIIYGLGNLIENAVDFAHSAASVMAQWNKDSVTIAVCDDGPGFALDILGRLGEPYVTSRADRRAKSEEGSGLGLGLFIAKTLLERSGASVVMTNLSAPSRGAKVAVRWPRHVFEPPAGRQETHHEGIPSASQPAPMNLGS